MSDSFFGFDASLPGQDDDGGGGRSSGRSRSRGVLGGGAGSGGRGSDSEGEYDALNDETFGLEAREDDWEDLHENLVRLDQREGGDGDSGPDSDLDINFSSVGIDNFELDNETEPEARLQLDPSVWTMPSKPETPRHTLPAPVPLPPVPSVVGTSTPIPGPVPDRFVGPLARFPPPNPGQIRICSLEEIEQNMIKQQQEQMRRAMTPLPRPPPGFPQPSNLSQPMPPGPNPMLHRPVPGPIGFPSPAPLSGGAGVTTSVGGGPLGPPIGFPPTNMPPPPPGGQQGGVGGGGPFPFPMNFQSGPPPHNSNNNSSNNNNSNNNASFSQRLVEEIQQNHPMLPHYRQHQPPPPGTIAQPPLPMPGPGPGQGLPSMPPPLANFKHHPFMPPHHHPHPPFPPNWNGPPHHQQHHNNMPLHHLHGGHHHHPGHHHFPQQMPPPGHHPGGLHPHHLLQQQQLQQHHHQHHNNLQQQQGQAAGRERLQNGKLNRHFEYDEYANMMSERAKHWLLGIQLSQLNKETAYYNDYYFCVFRDRKERERGAERESKAHKDNTFYHPFSQQMLHRNGLIRERRNSDNSSSTKDNIKEMQPRRYKPVQFENSLGKLQCGSVIAPRKIIDQDIVVDRSVTEGSGGVGAGGGSVGQSSDTAAHQRRSRQVLLHVENLYRLVLRLEDMSNPLSIEAKLQMKEKRDKERLLAQQENRATDEQNNVAGGTGSKQVATPNAVSDVEQDTVENLLERILPGLNAEGILRLLSVRKGKLLLKRIQKALSEHEPRWTVWCTILATLAVLPKRDREDADDQLSPLFAQLELHVKYASAAELVPLFETLLNTDQLLALVPKCKFLLLTILTLIAQMEQLATIGGVCEVVNGNGAEGNGSGSDDQGAGGKQPLQEVTMARWMALLRELARVLDSATTVTGATGKPQKVLLKLDSSCGIVKQLRAHLRRHQELDLERKLQTIVSIVDSTEEQSSKATEEALPDSVLKQ